MTVHCGSELRFFTLHKHDYAIQSQLPGDSLFREPWRMAELPKKRVGERRGGLKCLFPNCFSILSGGSSAVLLRVRQVVCDRVQPRSNSDRRVHVQAATGQ